MANWKLQYRTLTGPYTDIVIGPDPVTNSALVVLPAKKQFLNAAEALNSTEAGAPLLANLRRVLSDLEGYEYVGVSLTNTPTSFKAKMLLLVTALSTTTDEAPTNPIRSTAVGVFPATVRAGVGSVSPQSAQLDEDRGTLTSLGAGLGYSASERKEWRAVLT